MPAKTAQPSPRALAARRNGALGGLARAKKYSAEQRKAWSSKGGKALQDTYGSDFKVFMSNSRKTVGRYRKPAAETVLAKSRLAKKKKVVND